MTLPMNFERSTSDIDEDLSRDRMAQFVELYSGHYPRLQFYIMAMLPTANDASDVLQETSLVLWRRFDSFQIGTNFFAWACKIARLQALKYRERQGRTGQLFELSVLEKLATEACREDSVSAVPLAALENCIKKLSDGDRKLIRKRYQPGSSVAQIARDIGRSANSISKSLGRIRRALFVCVERTLVHEGRE
jgi:RNA polymerase sigma-70 factor (ECF subfamily)